MSGRSSKLTCEISTASSTSPNTQIKHLQACFPQHLRLPKGKSSLRILVERFGPLSCNPTKTQLHHHPLPYLSSSSCSLTALHCLLSLSQQLSLLNPASATPTRHKQDFWQAPEWGWILGQSGSHHHQHSTALGSHPLKKLPSFFSDTPPCDGSASQVKAFIGCPPPDSLLDPKSLARVLVMMQMELMGLTLHPRSSWLHRATSAWLWHSHVYPATSSSPPWDSS